MKAFWIFLYILIICLLGAAGAAKYLGITWRDLRG